MNKLVNEENNKELSVLEQEKAELELLKQKVKDFEELQRIRAEKEKLKSKVKEMSSKPSMFSTWGKRFAKNVDDDPLGLDKFR